MKKILFLFVMLLCLGAKAQVYTSDVVYPLSVDGSRRVITGFTSLDGANEQSFYAKAFLWAVDNICPKQLDGMVEVNHKNHSYTFRLEIESMAGSSFRNHYFCNVRINIIDSKMVFYVYDINVKGSGLIKTITPLENYKIETNAKHAEIGNDFARSISSVLDKMFHDIQTQSLGSIKHWDEIVNRKVVKGMTMDECRLAFGKPQIEKEDGAEVQWMYTSSFFLFFKKGVVSSFIK